MATGASPGEAFAEARAQCMESGALEEDCLRTNWCFPAGWSADVFVQHREGPHWHEIVCGLPTRSIAETVARQICERAERPDLIECALVQIYDDTGERQIDN